MADEQRSALMAGRARARMRPIDYWPGFVDALSTMLLVIIFLLSVFMLAQFFLAREVTGKDTALTKLNRADRGAEPAARAGALEQDGSRRDGRDAVGAISRRRSRTRRGCRACSTRTRRTPAPTLAPRPRARSSSWRPSRIFRPRRWPRSTF